MACVKTSKMARKVFMKYIALYLHKKKRNDQKARVPI